MDPQVSPVDGALMTMHINDIEVLFGNDDGPLALFVQQAKIAVAKILAAPAPSGAMSILTPEMVTAHIYRREPVIEGQACDIRIHIEAVDLRSRVFARENLERQLAAAMCELLPPETSILFRFDLMSPYLSVSRPA